MKSKKKEFKEWDNFHKNNYNKIYPQWPNEILLKLIFGNYLKNKINIKSNYKILDVGCGFGNNLLPFNKLSEKMSELDINEIFESVLNKVTPQSTTDQSNDVFNIQLNVR